MTREAIQANEGLRFNRGLRFCRAIRGREISVCNWGSRGPAAPIRAQSYGAGKPGKVRRSRLRCSFGFISRCAQGEVQGASFAQEQTRNQA
jgi:hypothetical protein